MAPAKEKLPTGLIVRSVEGSRNRSGFTFTREQSYVDVAASGLDAEGVKAIQDDRYLMVVEADKAPKDAVEAKRSNPDGTPFRTFTNETATPEQEAAFDAGEDVPPHPSSTQTLAPTGGSVEGRIEAAKGTLQDLEPTALNASTKGDKRTTK